MGIMKNIALPILEDLSDSFCTRVELHDRSFKSIDWSIFKQVFEGLIEEGLIEKKGILKNTTYGMPADLFGLSREGVTVVRELSIDDCHS